jgi:hypothetical protein
MKLSQMTAMPQGKAKTEAKTNNYTYPREDVEAGSEATFDIARDCIDVAQIEALMNERVTTKSGKEVYAVLTFPRGSIMLNGQVLNGVRMGITMFAVAE